MKHQHKYRKRFAERVPVWQKIVIVIVVIALPLFFLYYREVSLTAIFGNQNQNPSYLGSGFISGSGMR